MTLLLLRQQIDSIDRSVLELLAQRMRVAAEIRTFKTQALDAGREAEVRELWKATAEELDLSEPFAMTLLDAVLTESKRIQNEAA
jgi:chorismate mutase